MFPPSASQITVYDNCLKPLVDDVLQGYTAALLAYGQTGAGKTYTMANDAPEAVGLIPRAAQHLFAATDASQAWSITMSYIQIYMEKVHDLLNLDSTNLQLREDANGQVILTNVHRMPVSNLEDCLSLLHLGTRNRATAATNLNELSSRSHAVVIFDVTQTQEYGTGLQQVQHGRLFLVDLAGSERVKKSGSIGQRAEEARSINLSLTTLGKCIAARATGDHNHVPFRESKLTRLLQGALSGEAKTAIIVSVTDATQHVDETQQSLQFGCQAMKVTVQARVNTRVEYSSLSGGDYPPGSQYKKAALLEQALLEQGTALKQLQEEMGRNSDHSRAVMLAMKKEHEAAQRQIKEKEEQYAELLATVQYKDDLVKRAAQRVASLEAAHNQHIRELDAQHKGKEAVLASQLQDALGNVKKARQLAAASQQAERQVEQQLKELHLSMGERKREVLKLSSELDLRDQENQALNSRLR